MLAYIAGVVIFSEPLAARSVIGAVFVVSACALVLSGRKDAPDAIAIGGVEA